MDVHLLDWPGCCNIRVYFAVSEEIMLAQKADILLAKADILLLEKKYHQI
jgi:hypothetical protein